MLCMSKKKRARVRGGASHICPKCGYDTHVLVTRRLESGAVKRMRECIKCVKRFETVEIEK